MGNDIFSRFNNLEHDYIVSTVIHAYIYMEPYQNTVEYRHTYYIHTCYIVYNTFIMRYKLHHIQNHIIQKISKYREYTLQSVAIQCVVLYIEHFVHIWYSRYLYIGTSGIGCAASNQCAYPNGHHDRHIFCGGFPQ